jgi:hypothetical protein
MAAFLDSSPRWAACVAKGESSGKGQMRTACKMAFLEHCVARYRISY